MADSAVKKTLKVKRPQSRPVMKKDAASENEPDQATPAAADGANIPSSNIAPAVQTAPAKKPPYTYAAILALFAVFAFIALLILQYIEWDTYDAAFPRAMQVSVPTQAP